MSAAAPSVSPPPKRFRGKVGRLSGSEPRRLNVTERRRLVRRYRLFHGFKDAARQILSSKLTPTWREDVAAEARAGKLNFYQVLVWSLVISGMGDVDLLDPVLVGKGRPPDVRAARVLAELAQELGVEQTPASGPTFQITLIGGRWPDLPTPAALPEAAIEARPVYLGTGQTSAGHLPPVKAEMA